MTVLDRNAPISVARPNWSTPYGVEYAFRTGVITSRDGSEQRESLRQSARISLKFEASFRRDQIVRHDADIVLGQDQQFLVRAEWTRAFLASDHTSGTNTFSVLEVPRWMAAGAAIIVTSGTTEDYFEITSVSETTITVANNSGHDIPAGSMVQLAFFARNQQQVQLQSETAMVRTGNMRYEVTPGTVQQGVLLGLGYGFNWRELLLRKPNWLDRPRVTFLDEWEVFDPGVGLLDIFTPQDHNNARYEFGYHGLDAHLSSTLVDFFIRHKGRRTAFWVPTWSRDIMPLPMAGIKKFKVSGSDFRDAYDGNPVFRTLIAFWPDGTYQCNQITSIGGTTDSEVTCIDDWKYAIDEDTRIMWLVMARFDSDTLDVAWLTNEVAEISFPIRTLEAEDYPGYDSFGFVDGTGGGGDGDGAFQPSSRGPAPMHNITPGTDSAFVDLWQYGFTQDDIDSGALRAALKVKGHYYEGNPLPGTDTTVSLSIGFRGPDGTTVVNPVSGETVTFSEVQDTNIDATLNTLTVPPGTRYVRFRTAFALTVTSVWTPTLEEWYIGRAR